MTVGNKTTVTNSMNYYVQESPSVKRRCYAFVKRAFDIVASAAALIILSPIMLIAAILVMWMIRESVLRSCPNRQKRESRLRCGNSVVCT